MGKASTPPTGAPGPGRDFLTGQLLIAMPNMADPRFERSVVLICAHDADQAMGVIVNKPMEDLSLGRLLAHLDIDAPESAGGEPVRFSGPVQSDRGIVVHTLDYRIDSTMQVTPEIGLTATREILLDLIGAGDRPAPARHFLGIGYAGWGPGQLEDEIAMNAWAHGPAEAEIIFCPDADRAWSLALERLGVTGANLSPEWASARDGDAPLH